MGELTGAILAGAVTGGILGGFSEGLRQLLYGEQLNVGRILAAAASGVLFGGVMGAVGYGLQRGFQKLHKLFASACFVAGTLVATPEGYVPIEEIQAGDIVYAADEEGNVVLSRVTHAFTRTATALIDLTLRDAEGVTTTITGTPEHPFYVPAAGEYVPMGQLVAGTALRTLDGRAATVVAVAVRRERVTVYNFEVAETHTYFVAGSTGGAGVWVHNAKCGGERTLYHYTDEAGARSIEQSGVIRANRGKVYVTPEQISADDALNALFAGNPNYVGKGTYVIEFQVKPGVFFEPGTQPNELIHYGSLRDGRQIDIIGIFKNIF